MATLTENRQFAQYVLGHSGLDEAIEWIRDNLHPHEVFGEDELNEVGKDYAEREGLFPPLEASELEDYDAGLLNDFGGGNVEWWQDYLRTELGRCNDHWREQIG